MDSSNNWTIHDKLAMYKGLINICERERKNRLNDSSTLIEENEKKINDLRNEIKKLRIKASMAEKGATAEVSTLLQQNKPLELILQNKSLEEMKYYLILRNAERRQYLNKIVEENAFAQKKLETATVELHKLLNKRNWDDDKKDHRQALNNRIQEFGAKTQLCRNIQCMYQKAINFLRKDQANYSAILSSLKENAKLQQISMSRAVEMGQLANEEMANMREECQIREQDVRMNMEIHQNALQAFQYDWNILLEESQSLIRGEESVVAWSGDFLERKIETNTELETQVFELRELLKSMKNAILVPHFDDIIPRMLEQLKQNEKLIMDLQTNDNLFDLLPKKIIQAQLILAATINQAQENEALFLSKRNHLFKELKESNEELEAINKIRNKTGMIAIQLRNGLACIWNIIENIPGSARTTFVLELNDIGGILNDELARARNDYWGQAIVERLKQVTDLVAADAQYHNSCMKKLYQTPSTEERKKRAKYSLNHLRNKTSLLHDVIYKKLKDEEYARAISSKAREVIKTYKIEDEKEIPKVTTQMIEDLEDPSVPSRTDIKAESKKIYDLATTNPFDK